MHAQRFSHSPTVWGSWDRTMTADQALPHGTYGLDYDAIEDALHGAVATSGVGGHSGQGHLTSAPAAHPAPDLTTVRQNRWPPCAGNREPVCRKDEPASAPLRVGDGRGGAVQLGKGDGEGLVVRAREVPQIAQRDCLAEQERRIGVAAPM